MALCKVEHRVARALRYKRGDMKLSLQDYVARAFSLLVFPVDAVETNAKYEMYDKKLFDLIAEYSLLEINSAKIQTLILGD